MTLKLEFWPCWPWILSTIIWSRLSIYGRATMGITYGRQFFVHFRCRLNWSWPTCTCWTRLRRIIGTPTLGYSSRTLFPSSEMLFWRQPMSSGGERFTSWERLGVDPWRKASPQHSASPNSTSSTTKSPKLTPSGLFRYNSKLQISRMSSFAILLVRSTYSSGFFNNTAWYLRRGNSLPDHDVQVFFNSINTFGKK